MCYNNRGCGLTEAYGATIDKQWQLQELPSLGLPNYKCPSSYSQQTTQKLVPRNQINVIKLRIQIIIMRCIRCVRGTSVSLA